MKAPVTCTAAGYLSLVHPIHCFISSAQTTTPRSGNRTTHRDYLNAYIPPLIRPFDGRPGRQQQCSPPEYWIPSITTLEATPRQFSRPVFNRMVGYIFSISLSAVKYSSFSGLEVADCRFRGNGIPNGLGSSPQCVTIHSSNIGNNAIATLCVKPPCPHSLRLHDACKTTPGSSMPPHSHTNTRWVIMTNYGTCQDSPIPLENLRATVRRIYPQTRSTTPAS